MASMMMTKIASSSLVSCCAVTFFTLSQMSHWSEKNTNCMRWRHFNGPNHRITWNLHKLTRSWKYYHSMTSEVKSLIVFHVSSDVSSDDPFDRIVFHTRSMKMVAIQCEFYIPRSSSSWWDKKKIKQWDGCNKWLHWTGNKYHELQKKTNKK